MTSLFLVESLKKFQRFATQKFTPCHGGRRTCRPGRQTATTCRRSSAPPLPPNASEGIIDAQRREFKCVYLYRRVDLKYCTDIKTI